MKKAISILLVAALLLGFIAMTVSVASADAPEAEINAVAITGVTEPVVGQMPTLEGIELGGADGVSMEALWYEVTAQGHSVPDGAFVSGKTYVLYIYLSTELGNNMSQDIAVTVNGKPADERTWAGNNDVRAQMVYHLGEINILSELTVSQVPTVAIGQQVDVPALLAGIGLNQGLQLDTDWSTLYKNENYDMIPTTEGVYEKASYCADLRITSQEGYYLSPHADISLPAGVTYEIMDRETGHIDLRVYFDLRDPVDAVAVTGVPQLEIGGKFTTEGLAVSEGAVISGAFWMDDMGMTMQPDSDVMGDTSYQLCIPVRPQSGSYFTKGVSVKLDGLPEGTSDKWYCSKDSDYIWIYYRVQLTNPKVGTVRVEGLPESISVGAAPAVTLITDNRRVENLTVVGWSDYDGNPVTAFEAGKDYYLECTATAKQGYSFSQWEGFLDEKNLNGPDMTDVVDGVLHSWFRYSTKTVIDQLDLTLAGVSMGDKVQDVKVTFAQQNVQLQSVEVQEITGEGTVEATGSFAKDKCYEVVVIMEPKEGYEFTFNTDATLNGEEYQLEYVDYNMAVFIYHISGNQVIDSVAVTVPQPVAGGTITAPTVADPNVKIAEWYWYDSTVYEGDLTSGAFLEGHRYELNVTLEAAQGYEFSERAEMTINGQWPESWYSFGEKNEMFTAYWEVSLCKTIEKVELPAMPEKLEIGDLLVSGAVQVPNGAKYTVVGDWHENYQQTDGTVEGGIIYEYRYTIYPEAGYEVNEDTQILVGGKEWDGNWPNINRDYTWISRYYPVDMTLIEKVELTVAVPALGEEPQKVIVPEGAPYRAHWQRWNECDSLDDDGMELDGVFKDGKYYVLRVDVRAGLNYAFANKVQVVLNGKEVTPLSADNDGLWLWLALDMGKLEVVPGKVENTTNEKENAHEAKLEVPAEELADKLLTEEEKQLVAAGASVAIDLVVEDISKDIPAEDKALVEKALGENTVGLFLDITLTKQVGDNAPVKITQTNGAVTVTITVPETLRNTNAKVARTYKVIRVHEGKTDVLDAIYDGTTGKLSFQTDAFSTYALVYTDVAVPAAGADTGTNAETGDDMPVAALVILAVLAVAGLAVVIIGKKKFAK